MHRYFLGIALIQLISVVVFWVNMDITIAWSTELALKIVLPLLLVATTAALWFDAIGRGRAARTIAKLQSTHAREREKLQLKSEREKHKVIEKAHKEITKQSRRVSTKANLKVGMAMLFAGGAGVIMLLIELVTFGMMTLMTAGGALGGYLFRARRELPVLSEPDVIETGEFVGDSARVVNDPPPVLKAPHKDKTT